MTSRRVLPVLLGACLLCAAPASGQDGSLFSKLKDPEDGKLDLSEFLQSRSGFLPVPLIITEPAIGYGGGLAPFFLKRSDAPAASTTGRLPTPTMFGAAAFGTENGSWGAGGGYLLPFSGDRYRWTGLLGYLHLNLKFYGFGAESPLQQSPASFTMKFAGTTQRAQAKLGGSDFYLGLQYVFVATKSRFEGELPAGITAAELSSNAGGLGGTLEYDTRDNFLSPQRGVDLFGEGTAFEPAFGSDTRFGRARAQALFFGRILEHWGYGLRVDARYAWGDVPFYMRQILDMRGLTVGRYLDNVAVLAEGEPRYWIDRRWMVLAFGGVGRISESWSALGSAETVWAAGVGFRYLLARKLGLQGGLDFGFGPSNQRAVYIQVGSAWR